MAMAIFASVCSLSSLFFRASTMKRRTSSSRLSFIILWPRTAVFNRFFRLDSSMRVGLY